MGRTVFAALAALVIAAFPSPGRPGSAVPPYTIDQLELINDGPFGLTPLCLVRIWQVIESPLTWTNPANGDLVDLPAGAAVGKCMLQFTNKATPNFRLILPTPHIEKFHGLTRVGEPLDVLYIWDDGHHSSDRLWLGMWFAPNVVPAHSLRKDDTTFLITNAVPDNAVLIDARPRE